MLKIAQVMANAQVVHWIVGSSTGFVYNLIGIVLVFSHAEIYKLT